MTETWREHRHFCVVHRISEANKVWNILIFYFLDLLVCLLDLFSCPYTVYTLICFWFMGTIKSLLH